MPPRFVCLLGLAFGVACAGRPAPQITPATHANLDAAFNCAASAIENAGYRVSKDAGQLTVRGLIREDLATDPATLGGTVGGEGSRRNVGDVPAPYEVDGVDASVSLDSKGGVKIAAQAYTGVGASSKSGYAKHEASARGATTVKQVAGCALP